jgi:hypothetical protein
MTILHLITVPWWNACAYYAVTLAAGLNGKGYRILVAGRPGSPALTHACEAGLRTINAITLHRNAPAFFFGTFVVFENS